MKRILLLGAALYIAAFIALVFGQNSLIYPFNPTLEQPERRITEHRLSSADGETLIVWAAKPAIGKPTILYFHGNAGNLHNRAARFDRMLDRGYGIVAMAYRGSSGSTGTPSETAIRADSLLVHNQLNTLIGTPRKLVIYGESLGSAVAIQLAALHQPDGLILEAPFTSLTSRASEAVPYFPVKLGLRDEWNSLGQIPNITAPLLVMHGTADTVVPFTHGEAIFAAAAASNKTFRRVDGLGHNGHWSVAGQKAIYRFIDGL